MNVQGWPAARWHDGFPQGVLAVRVVAGRKKTIHIADDGDGVAYSGLS